jgi:hypothetical protein
MAGKNTLLALSSNARVAGLARCGRSSEDKGEPFLFVIAGLDPAIHLRAKKMDYPNSGLPEFGTR